MLYQTHWIAEIMIIIFSVYHWNSLHMQMNVALPRPFYIHPKCMSCEKNPAMQHDLQRTCKIWLRPRSDFHFDFPQWTPHAVRLLPIDVVEDVSFASTVEVPSVEVGAVALVVPPAPVEQLSGVELWHLVVVAICCGERVVSARSQRVS